MNSFQYYKTVFAYIHIIPAKYKGVVKDGLSVHEKINLRSNTRKYAMPISNKLLVNY